MTITAEAAAASAEATAFTLRRIFLPTAEVASTIAKSAIVSAEGVTSSAEHIAIVIVVIRRAYYWFGIAYAEHCGNESRYPRGSSSGDRMINLQLQALVRSLQETLPETLPPFSGRDERCEGIS
jgi:hypothetical protein